MLGPTIKKFMCIPFRYRSEKPSTPKPPEPVTEEDEEEEEEEIKKEEIEKVEQPSPSQVPVATPPPPLTKGILK